MEEEDTQALQRPRAESVLNPMAAQASLVEYLSRLCGTRNWIMACFAKMGLSIELEDDLHKGLQNGILLCYLMQNFEPQSIPRIHESADAPFNFRQNIVFFLAACEMLGVPKNKLFRVNDLWDNVSMVSVVDCLVAFAHTCHAKWPEKAGPFDVASEEESQALADTLSEEKRFEILRQIKLCSSSSSLSLQKRRATIGYRLSLKNVATEVSGFLSCVSSNKTDEMRLLQGITRCQAVFRAVRERQNFQNRLRDSAYRERVSFEILSSEHSFVDALAMCVELFLRPLEALAAAGKPILTEEKIAIIFSGIETILASNRRLLSELEKRLEKWHPNLCVGDVFMLIDQEFLGVYTNYIQNYSEAVRVFKREQRKKPFKEFLSKQKADPRSKGRELDQFLIMPVQRIPRYNLLLRELVKHTWPMHPDFAVLDAGVERLSNIAMFLNEKKREAEALQRTFHVQEILDKGGSNVQVSNGVRRYLHEGELYDSQGKPIVVYLFSDLLVICGDKNDRAHTEADERRANRKKIKFSELVELEEGMLVTDGVDDVATGKFPFLIRLARQNRSVHLTAATLAIKREWLEIVRALQVKLSTLAMLHVSDDSSGSPSMQPSNGSRTARGSKRSDGKMSHRRSKSKVEDITAMLQQRKSESAPIDMSQSHDVVPVLPERKNRFFPLPSPRMGERHSEAVDGAPPKPEKSKSSIRKAKLGAVPTTPAVGGVQEDSPANVISPTTASDESSPLDHLREEKFGKGSIRLRLGAVMKFTKLWDKETKEGGGPEEEGTDSTPEGSRRPSSVDASTQPSVMVRRPSHEALTPAINLNSPLSKRGTDSDDLAKLGKLMRGRTKQKDGESDEQLSRDSGIDEK